MLILAEGTAVARTGEYGGCSSVITLFFAKKSLTKTERCAGALWRKGNQLLVSPFFGAFPSDRIPKATKDASVHLLIYSSNSCTLNQRIPGNYTSEFQEGFEATI